MQKLMIVLMLMFLFSTTYSQSRFSNGEISINGFRNPSIGAEYRFHQISVHAGYYPTAFASGETTSFVKTGLTFWFLPVGKKENPSSFYAGASYMRGMNREYENKNAGAVEAGFRWMIWNGINLRLGGIAVVAKGESVKINPAPGISYSFFIR